MNDELIKRIDEKLSVICPYDEEGERTCDFDTWAILYDCHAALSKKYVPLKPLEWAEQMPGLKEADLYKVIMAESVVIRHAGLEVQE